MRYFNEIELQDIKYKGISINDFPVVLIDTLLAIENNPIEIDSLLGLYIINKQLRNIELSKVSNSVKDSLENNIASVVFLDELFFCKYSTSDPDNKGFEWIKHYLKRQNASVLAKTYETANVHENTREYIINEVRSNKSFKFTENVLPNKYKNDAYINDLNERSWIRSVKSAEYPVYIPYNYGTNIPENTGLNWASALLPGLNQYFFEKRPYGDWYSNKVLQGLEYGHVLSFAFWFSCAKLIIQNDSFESVFDNPYFYSSLSLWSINFAEVVSYKNPPLFNAVVPGSQFFTDSRMYDQDYRFLSVAVNSTIFWGSVTGLALSEFKYREEKGIWINLLNGSNYNNTKKWGQRLFYYAAASGVVNIMDVVMHNDNVYMSHFIPGSTQLFRHGRLQGLVFMIHSLSGYAIGLYNMESDNKLTALGGFLYGGLFHYLNIRDLQKIPTSNKASEYSSDANFLSNITLYPGLFVDSKKHFKPGIGFKIEF